MQTIQGDVDKLGPAAIYIILGTGIIRKISDQSDYSILSGWDLNNSYTPSPGIYSIYKPEGPGL